MGRELRRKEERKNKNRKVQMQEQLDTSIKVTTIIKLIVFVVLLLFVLWFVVATFITKEIDISGDDETNASETADTSSVSNRILASATFNQKEEVYYVYYYDFTDEDEAISSAISGRSDLKIYRVDTSSSLNQNYITEEEGNKNITGIDDLKVKNPTILQITNDQVTAYYEGSSNILAFLNQ